MGKVHKQIDFTTNEFFISMSAGEDAIALIDKNGKLYMINECIRKLETDDEISYASFVECKLYGYSKKTATFYEWNCVYGSESEPVKIKIDDMYSEATTICDCSGNLKLLCIGYDNKIIKENKFIEKAKHIRTKTAFNSINSEIQKKIVNEIKEIREKKGKMQRCNSCAKEQIDTWSKLEARTVSAFKIKYESKDQIFKTLSKLAHRHIITLITTIKEYNDQSQQLQLKLQKLTNRISLQRAIKCIKAAVTQNKAISQLIKIKTKISKTMHFQNYRAIVANTSKLYNAISIMSQSIPKKIHTLAREYSRLTKLKSTITNLINSHSKYALLLFKRQTTKPKVLKESIYIIGNHLPKQASSNYECTMYPEHENTIQCVATTCPTKSSTISLKSDLIIRDSTTIVVSGSKLAAASYSTEADIITMSKSIQWINESSNFYRVNTSFEVRKKELFIQKYADSNISGVLDSHNLKQNTTMEEGYMHPLVHIHTEKISNKIKEPKYKDTRAIKALAATQNVKTLNIDLCKSNHNDVIAKYRNSESYSIRNSCKNTYKSKLNDKNSKTSILQTTYNGINESKKPLELSDCLNRADICHNDTEIGFADPVDYESTENITMKASALNKFINKFCNAKMYDANATYSSKTDSKNKPKRCKTHVKTESMGREMIECKNECNILNDVENQPKRVIVHKKTNSREITINIGKPYLDSLNYKSRDNSSIRSPFIGYKTIRLDESSRDFSSITKTIATTTYATQRIGKYKLKFNPKM